jgi:hypothetical protein
VTSLEELIDVELLSLGFLRRENGVYEFQNKCSSVKALLFIASVDTRRHVPSLNFGLRNDEAERFGVDMIRQFGGDFLAKSLRYNSTTSCAMRYDLFRLPGVSYEDLSRINVDTTIVSVIHSRVKNYLIPIFSETEDNRGLLKILLSNEEPCPWSANNGAIRAAQVVCLSRQIGVFADECFTILKARATFISNGFMPGSPYRENPLAYLSAITGGRG